MLPSQRPDNNHQCENQSLGPDPSWSSVMILTAASETDATSSLCSSRLGTTLFGRSRCSARCLWPSRHNTVVEFLDPKSFLYQDGPSSPIRYTNVFSHAELDLHIEWLPTSVILEVQAHAVTRTMRILNFFVPNSGSPCCTQLGIIFSDLKFHQE